MEINEESLRNMAMASNECYKALRTEVADKETLALSDAIIKLCDGKRNGVIIGACAVVLGFILVDRDDDLVMAETAGFGLLVRELVNLTRTKTRTMAQKAKDAIGGLTKFIRVGNKPS